MKVVLTALSPIAHGSFGPSTGNEVQIRRMALVNVDGMPRVPCISGNALRGVLRRLVFRDLFATSNVNRENLPSPAWDRVYAVLCNGGHLERSESRVDPDERRALRASLPPLSLFGGALYSYMLPGHMNVGILWPRCRETGEAGVTTPAEGAVNAEDLIEEVSHVRHVDREEQDPEVSGVTPMPTTIEVLSTGTVLESRIEFADHATPEERGSLLRGLELLTTIGAKSSAGFGRVRVAHDGDNADLEAYRQWYASGQGDAIRSLVSTLGPPKVKRKRKTKKR